MHSSHFPRRFVVSLFFVAGSLGILIARFVAMNLSAVPVTIISNAQNVVTIMLGLGIAVALFMKGNRRVVWEGVFLAALFLGCWYLGLVLLPWKIALFLASTLTLAHVLLRTVIIHNLFYLVGALGIALDFAGTFQSELLVVLLVAFTAYDILAAHPDGPIVAVAGRLIRWGLVPGFIVPSSFSGQFQTVDTAIRSNGALLGAGDVILPMAMLMRAALIDLRLGLACLAGLLIGAVILGRGSMHPRAALPPLAVGVTVPFVVFLLIGYLSA